MGVIEGTTSVYNGMDHRLEFHGETGNVLVEGARIVRWETEDGQKRSKHEVVAQSVTFLPKRGEAGGDSAAPHEEHSYDDEQY